MRSSPACQLVSTQCRTTPYVRLSCGSTTAAPTGRTPQKLHSRPPNTKPDHHHPGPVGEEARDQFRIRFSPVTRSAICVMNCGPTTRKVLVTVTSVVVVGGRFIGGNKHDAARTLALSRATIYRKINDYGIA